MEQKRNNFPWVLVSALAVVLVALVYSWLALRNRLINNTLVKQELSEFEVGNIKIYKDMGGDRWFLAEKGETGRKQPVDEELVRIFLEKTKTIKLDRLVAESKDAWSNYRIASESAVLKLGEYGYRLGGLNSSFDGSYINPSNGEKVFEIPTIWGNGDLLSTDYWKIKWINNQSVYQIKKVTFGDMVVEPKDGKWQNQDWIEKLAYLKTGELIGSFMPENSTVYEFEITADNDEVRKIVIGKNKDQVWGEFSGYYYKIDTEVFERLTSGPNLK